MLTRANSTIFQAITYKSNSNNQASANLLGGAVDSLRFKLRLSASAFNPIGNLNLTLILIGTAPQPQLTMHSTDVSEIFYNEVVPISAYSKQINWQIPVVEGYLGQVYVMCGQVRSNVVEFRQTK